MTVSNKIKRIDNKIEQNKAQHDLDRETAKISALSSGNIGKYKFLTGKDVLPEIGLLQKAATFKKSFFFLYHYWWRKTRLLTKLESDEDEVKERNGIKTLTPNRLLSRLPVLLAQIKAGHNP